MDSAFNTRVLGRSAPTQYLYDEVSQLEQDSWVTVEGTIFIEEFEYDGQKYIEPQIEVIKITSAEAVAGYVYPY